MMIESIRKIFIAIVLINLICLLKLCSSSKFQEKLILKTLTDGKILSHFQFETFVANDFDRIYEARQNNHYDLFPLSLTNLLTKLQVHEFHLSLSKGFWKNSRWNLSPLDSPPNAFLKAWFLSDSNSDDRWKQLISVLAGQFCASINLIKPTETLRPQMSYSPSITNETINLGPSKNAYVASLPREAICTENLSPFRNILPCHHRKGLASLLKATKLFDSQFFSMNIEFKLYCLDLKKCDSTLGFKLTQDILVVHNPPHYLDGRFGWTINSLFGESLKNYCPLSDSSHVLIDATTLNMIDGAKLLLSPSKFINFETKPMNELESISVSSTNRLYADYDLKKFFSKIQEDNSTKKTLNIGIQYAASFENNRFPYSVQFDLINVQRHLNGIGVSTGGLTLMIENSLSNDVECIYLETIPWFLRIYLHTLKIENYNRIEHQRDHHPQLLHSEQEVNHLKPISMFYQPSIDRIRPHHIEIKILLPKKSITKISFDFDHQFMRWNEFPPDPNRGLDISPAVLTLFLDRNDTKSMSKIYDKFMPQILDNYLVRTETNLTIDLSDAFKEIQSPMETIPIRLYTKPLIVMMPTPDFSMPYNVICLVSTALSIAFGPIFNLTTRRNKTS
ncbi:SH3 domain-containing kinase-binding protein 1 [Sarcoptes scabiei]|nr:SH3 domain-containing kinase-binding protein 1 [Sarcoptes scabiei]